VFATGVNRRGWAVGGETDLSGGLLAYAMLGSKPSGYVAFVLDSSTSGPSEALAVNGHNQAVGWIQPSGAARHAFSSHLTARGATFKVLPQPFSGRTEAAAINDSG